MRRLVGVIGASQCSAEIAALAEQVGRLLAQQGYVVLTGGRGGVMEAACRGAKQAGGLTVGILPGIDRKEANPFVDIAIVTGLHEARNAVIAHAAEILIAIAGGYGTLSEIALGLKLGRPVIGLRTWTGVKGLRLVEQPEEAVAKVREFFATH